MFEIMNITGWGSELMRTIGSTGFDLFINPLIWWTMLVVCLIPVIHWVQKRNVPMAYQMNISSLFLLPLGIVLSLGIWGGKQMYSSMLQSPGDSSAAESAAKAINQGWANIGTVHITQSTASQIDLSFWLGLLITAMLLVSIWQLGRFLKSRAQLKRFARTQAPIEPEEISNISKGNIALAKSIGRPVRFIVMDDKHIPFTFGYRNPLVVIPKSLTGEADKLNLAIRHELIHIRRKDYLVFNIVLIIQCLFWFHPLVHWLKENIATRQEQLTDKESVQHAGRKGAYMRMLYEMYSWSNRRLQQISQSASGKSNLLERIEYLQSPHFEKKSAYIRNLTITALVLLIGVIIGGFKVDTNAFDQNRSSDAVLADTTDKEEEVSFQFRIQKEGSTFILHSDKGTSWERLSFECAPSSDNCLNTVNKDGLAPGEQLDGNASGKFAFTIEVDPRNENRLILTSGKGTGWEKLTIKFSSMAKSWIINQAGAQPDLRLPEGSKAVVVYTGANAGNPLATATRTTINGRSVQKGDTIHINTEEITLESAVYEGNEENSLGKVSSTISLKDLNNLSRNIHPHTNKVHVMGRDSEGKDKTVAWDFKYMIISE